MKRSVLLAACLLMAGGWPASGAAQDRRDDMGREVIAAWGGQDVADALGAAERAAQRAAERAERIRVGRLPSVFRFGVSYSLPSDGEVRNVSIIFGDGVIEGDVRGDLVLVGGQTRIGRDARIFGEFLAIGTSVVVEPGARAMRDVTAINAMLDAPAEFAVSGDHFVLDPRSLGGWVDDFFYWATHGLLWGRPIVPSLQWVWLAVLGFFVLYFLLSTLFSRPIAASVRTLRARPLSALLVGMLVVLLVGPICALLAVSIVGLAVVPIVLVGLLAAAIVGKAAATRWLGTTVIAEGEGEDESRAAALRSFGIGFALLTIVYMVPVLGITAWALSGVFGLGATTLAFMAGYRRENPLPVRPVAVVAAPALATAPFPQTEGVIPMASSDTASAMFTTPSPVAGGATISGDTAVFPRAFFLERVASGVLDLILVLVAWQFLDPIARGNYFFLLLLSYFVGFWSWKGTTVGGIICQLRVVRVDGSPLRFVDALVRGLSGIFSLVVVGAGFWWILRDSDRQAWHDRIAGTYVVKVPRNYPI